MSKSALHWDHCELHGHQLHHFSLCVSCEARAVSPMDRYAAIRAAEPVQLTKTVRKAILSIDIKGPATPAEKQKAQRGMRRWRKTMEKARLEQGRGRA